MTAGTGVIMWLGELITDRGVGNGMSVLIDASEVGARMPVFSLDPVQTAWCAELRTLAADTLRPLAEKGEPGRVNRPLIAALGELGLLDLLYGAGALDLCLLRESLAHGCTEAETALALQGLGTCPIVRAGASGQQERCGLPEVMAGVPSPPSR